MDVIELMKQVQEEEDLIFESNYQELIKDMVKDGYSNLLVKCYVNNKKIDTSISRLIISNDRLLRACIDKASDMFDGDIGVIRKGDDDFYSKLIYDKRYNSISGVSLINKKSTMKFRRFFVSKKMDIALTVLHINIDEVKQWWLSVLVTCI